MIVYLYYIFVELNKSTFDNFPVYKKFTPVRSVILYKIPEAWLKASTVPLFIY